MLDFVLIDRGIGKFVVYLKLRECGRYGYEIQMPNIGKIIVKIPNYDFEKNRTLRDNPKCPNNFKFV